MMIASIGIRLGFLSWALQFTCDAVPLRIGNIGPRVPDAYAFGVSPDDEVYMERLEQQDDIHGNDGANKYKNLGQGPKMIDIQGPPIRVQAELREAMEAAEAKRMGIAAAPLEPVIKGAIIKKSRADQKMRESQSESAYDDNDDDNDDDDKIPDTEKTRLRTLGRMISSTDYDSASDYDINADANEIWEQIGRIARKFQDRSLKMKESLANVKDRKAAAVVLRKEVVGQLGELSVSLAETYPFGNKDGLLERLGAAKNTIQQSIDSILLGYNLHYDQDNL